MTKKFARLKSATATALAAVLLSGATHIAIADATTLTRPDQVINQNKEMTVKDGFGAQFWMTDNDRFYNNWLSADTRNFTPVLVTRRNIPLYLAVFAVDPGVKKVQRPDGSFKLSSDVTYDFQIFQPDGTPYPGGAGRNITGISGRPPASHMVALLFGRASLTFDLIDPVGEYTVKVVVNDNVRKVSIPLTRKIVLQD